MILYWIFALQSLLTAGTIANYVWQPGPLTAGGAIFCLLMALYCGALAVKN